MGERDDLRVHVTADSAHGDENEMWTGDVLQRWSPVHPGRAEPAAPTALGLAKAELD